MKKIKIMLLLAASISLFMTGCKQPADSVIPSEGEKSKKAHYVYGISGNKTVSVTINGTPCLLELNAETGKCKIVNGTGARAAETDELEADFQFYNGRLSIKAKQNKKNILGNKKAAENDPLFVTLKVDDIDGEAPAGDEESIKVCNDSDMADESADADPKVDFETQKFINKQTADPYKLPERSGKNYFAGQKIYNTVPDAGFLTPVAYENLTQEVTEDLFWGKKYSYKVVEDTDEYAIGFLYFQHVEEFDFSGMEEGCKDAKSFESFVEGMLATGGTLPGLKIDETIGKYKSVLKYLRAYYGLSDDCEDDEVIQVFLKSTIENFRKRTIVEVNAFWLKKDNGRFNLIQTSEPGLDFVDLYNNNIWFGVRTMGAEEITPVDVFVFGTQLLFPTEDHTETIYKDVIGVTEDTITYVDTTGDLPTRHYIKYSELVYKPEYTGLYTPLGNGQQDGMEDGMVSYMSCKDIFNDEETHKLSSFAAWTARPFIIKY